MAVIGILRTGAGAEHELSARGAGVGHREAYLDAELPARPGFALADALDLGRVQGVELALVGGLLGEQAGDDVHSFGADQSRLGIKLAGDIAIEPAEEGLEFAQMAHRLSVPAGVDQPAHLALGMLAQPQEGLAQFDAVSLGQPVQPFDAAIQQMAVAGVRHRLGLDRGVDGDPLEVLALRRPTRPARFSARSTTAARRRLPAPLCCQGSLRDLLSAIAWAV